MCGLVESANGNVIKEVSVTVIDPAGPRQGGPSVAISGLTSSDLVPGGSGDAFTVFVTGLDSNIDHELHTVVLNNLSAAFNQGCTRFTVATDIISVPSFTQSYTVYGCVAPGNNLWSYVQEVDGRTLANSGISNNPVNVADPKVSFKESSYSVDEEDEVDVTVELSHPSSNRIDIPITFGGTADSSDYSVRGLTSDKKLLFRNRSESEKFTIVALDEDDFDDETVVLGFGTLPSTVMGTESPSSATRHDRSTRARWR